MEGQRVVKCQKCHECRKLLTLKDDPNMSYVILNNDQISINESMLNPDLTIGELRKVKNKQQLLFHACQTGELLAKNVCYGCYKKLLDDLANSIEATEQVRQDYADNLRSMEEEKRSRTLTFTLESTKELKEEDLKSKEEELKREKEILLKINEGYDEELKELQEESKLLSQEENEYLSATKIFERLAIETERDASKITRLLEKAKEETHRLENFNSLDLLFKISTENKIGTINGFSLGCKPSKSVT